MSQRYLDVIFRKKFACLLVSLLLLLVVQPLFQEIVLVRFLLQAFFSVVLVAAVYAVSQRRGWLMVGLALLIPSMVGTWSAYLTQRAAVEFFAMSLSGLFCAFTAVTILRSLYRADRVTTDTVAGAVCAYLLLGLTWSFLYAALEFLHPASFAIGPSAAQEGSPGAFARTPLFFYYSFVTLTTLGYGDISPVTPLARAFSYVEAVIGQIYLAVLIARLVGLQIVHSRDEVSK